MKEMLEETSKVILDEINSDKLTEEEAERIMAFCELALEEESLEDFENIAKLHDLVEGTSLVPYSRIPGAKQNIKAGLKHIIKHFKYYGIGAAVLATIIMPKAIGYGAGAIAGKVAAGAGAGIAAATPSTTAGIVSGAGAIAGAAGGIALTAAVPVVAIAAVLGIGVLVQQLIIKKKFQQDFVKEVEKCLGKPESVKVKGLLLAMKNSKPGSRIYEESSEYIDQVRNKLLKNCKGR